MDLFYDLCGMVKFVFQTGLSSFCASYHILYLLLITSSAGFVFTLCFCYDVSFAYSGNSF